MFDEIFIQKCRWWKQRTSAGGEMWNILILEHIFVFQQVCQTAQAWTTDDGYFGTLLRVGQQPIRCLLVLIITVTDKMNTK